MDNKIIFGAVGMFILLFIVANHSTATPVDMTDCQDYLYKIKLNHAPTDITFYTIKDGEDVFFKFVPTLEKELTTVLHCGFDYHVIYEAEGFETYEDSFTIGTIVPVEIPVIEINLIPKEVIDNES